MDSLFVKSLINLQNRQDTILVHVNNLTSAIHQFENSSDRERAANEQYNDYKYIAYNKEKIAGALSEINSAVTGYYNSKS